MVLFTRLFQYLPPDGNEVMADRDELARVAGCTPNHVTDVMGELEAVGAVYRRREGRGVRYFVKPRLGTHLAGAARDRAQAEAPPLKLRLVEAAAMSRAVTRPARATDQADDQTGPGDVWARLRRHLRRPRWTASARIRRRELRASRATTAAFASGAGRSSTVKPRTADGPSVARARRGVAWS